MRIAFELEPADQTAFALAQVYSDLRKHRELIAHFQQVAAMRALGFTLTDARIAALCAEITDSESLDPNELARIRGKALSYFQRNVAGKKGQLATEGAKDRLSIEADCRNLLTHRDFRFLRGEEALAKLPDAERRAWRQLWIDINDVRKQATPHGGYIQSWLVLSESLSYVKLDGSKALDERQIPDIEILRPRAGDQIKINGNILRWKEYHTTDAFIDFQLVHGEPYEYRLAYAVCYVHSDADRSDLTMCVGSDDQAKILLNGREIYRNVRRRTVILDDDEIKSIALRKGTNVLVFQVVNEERGWGGSVRFLTEDGKVPQGIEYRLTP